MAKPGTVIGWKLDPGQRAQLLERFEPRYDEVVAHHVTLASEAADRPVPGAAHAEIVGQADDGSGVQALVVAIDGKTARPDGSVFHITWSLAAGRRARESNDLLKGGGWTPLPTPIPIKTTPARI